jgi:hypothetical protein
MITNSYISEIFFVTSLIFDATIFISLYKFLLRESKTLNVTLFNYLKGQLMRVISHEDIKIMLAYLLVFFTTIVIYYLTLNINALLFSLIIVASLTLFYFFDLILHLIQFKIKYFIDYISKIIIPLIAILSFIITFYLPITVIWILSYIFQVVLIISGIGGIGLADSLSTFISKKTTSVFFIILFLILPIFSFFSIRNLINFFRSIDSVIVSSLAYPLVGSFIASIIIPTYLIINLIITRKLINISYLTSIILIGSYYVGFIDAYYSYSLFSSNSASVGISAIVTSIFLFLIGYTKNLLYYSGLVSRKLNYEKIYSPLFLLLLLTSMFEIYYSIVLSNFTYFKNTLIFANYLGLLIGSVLTIIMKLKNNIHLLITSLIILGIILGISFYYFS